MSALQPPRINTTDPNQQEISDASDDHFSSASSNPASPINSSLSPDNVPITRVERVDDKALHGEVPGTPAYDMRMSDAVPDEIEIVPEGRRSRSATASGTRSRALSQLSTTSLDRPGSRGVSPGGSPIPKTVVEKVDDKPSYGEVEGTPAKEMRMADAMPDEVRRAPASSGKRLEGRTGLRGGSNGWAQSGEIGEDESEEGRQAWFRSMWEGDARAEEKQDDNVWDYHEDEPAQDAAEDEEDGFGDDFDDFAEGGEDDGDFGDFGEADDEPTPQPQPQPQRSTIPTAPDVLGGLPPLNLANLSPSEITEAIQPYIDAILPNTTPLNQNPDPPPSIPAPTPFLSDRSLSLWQQLVSPPPMQPPNWTRSRIRRLFLVSLGVPVDLDEILPPSKQKRLILPSIGLDDQPRPSAAIERLRDGGEANSSTTSLDSKTGQPKQSRRRPPTSGMKGPPPPPEFDVISARHIAATTEQALTVYSDAELQQHLLTLQTLNEEASKVLEYWLQRKDDGVKEKEALEGVIENLVGFVKGRRKAGGK